MVLFPGCKCCGGGGCVKCCDTLEVLIDSFTYTGEETPEDITGFRWALRLNTFPDNPPKPLPGGGCPWIGRTQTDNGPDGPGDVICRIDHQGDPAGEVYFEHQTFFGPGSYWWAAAPKPALCSGPGEYQGVANGPDVGLAYTLFCTDPNPLP